MSTPANPAVEEQIARLRRGVEAIVPEEELRRKLATGRPLRVKYGIDPTGIDVHLGHTVPLRKMRAFQDMGHKAVIIIGTYTAMVGDPSGRDETRAGLTAEQIEANSKQYLAQIRKIIDLDRAEVHRNGDWFARYNFGDVMALMGRITVQRMLERDDFTNRIRAGTPISLHECLYPLMQGQDSVEIKADVELGGSEQLFNLMMGRHLQSAAGQEPQVCVTLPILRGLDGGRRMGKSLGNYVGVGEPASEQFAKTMSIPDDLMREWFTLLTERSAEEIDALCDPAQTPPFDVKKRLGKDIVQFYHGVAVADVACKSWEDRFSRRQDPEEIPEVAIPAANLVDGGLPAGRLIVALGLASSGNEARRLIQQGGVTIGPDRTKLTDPNGVVPVEAGLVVRVGSRKIVRVALA
jgi:tyrosyl-tRNA synthetase